MAKVKQTMARKKKSEMMHKMPDGTMMKNSDMKKMGKYKTKKK